jgi:Fe-S oxidoreductase/nitrate reductase gamma subunit
MTFGVAGPVVLQSGDEVTRPTFFEITHVGKILFYVLAAVAIIAFARGLYLRFARYTRARPDSQDRLSELPSRVRRAVGTIGSNEPLFDRDPYAGVMHTFILWGFLTLFVGTLILTVEVDVANLVFDVSFWKGDFYRAYEVVMDAMGLLFVVGIAMAMYRRYWRRTDRLWGPRVSILDDAFVWTLFVLGVGGFLLEALGILARGNPDFEVVSFVGYAMALAFDAAGMTAGDAESIYPAIWWLHAVHALAFVALVPYFKAFHMLSSFANVVAQDDDAGRRLPGIPADLDHENATEIDHFSWKEQLDQDACTNCGRCSSVCPANASGRPLDPRNVILDLKAYRESLDDGGPERPIVGEFDGLRADGGTVAEDAGGDAGDAGPTIPDSPTTAGTNRQPREPDEDDAVIDRDAMESCMACMACMDACPVEIEHLTSFTRMNRQLVDEGEVDPNVQDVFQDVMQKGNSFGESPGSRADWADPLDVEPTDAREESVEYLWYVGDFPSYDDRNKEVARSLAKLLDAAGVEWGILYDDEKMDGNDVRRIGEEFLFLELAGHHVETFEECDFETIVCTDPHSFNTIKNEYPEVDFAEFADDPVMPFEFDEHWNADGEVDVKHWTQVLAELQERGDLGLTGDELDYTVTFHDPCHLGRYNGVYEPPRDLLTAAGCQLHEMPRNRSDSFCCGGGGGGVWMEHDEDPKPSEERLREANQDTDAGDAIEKFVVACPLCTTMFEDGRKTGGFEDDLDVVDVAELLVEALELEESAAEEESADEDDEAAEADGGDEAEADDADGGDVAADADDADGANDAESEPSDGDE